MPSVLWRNNPVGYGHGYPVGRDELEVELELDDAEAAAELAEVYAELGGGGGDVKGR